MRRSESAASLTGRSCRSSQSDGSKGSDEPRLLEHNSLTRVVPYAVRGSDLLEARQVWIDHPFRNIETAARMRAMGSVRGPHATILASAYLGIAVTARAT